MKRAVLLGTIAVLFVAAAVTAAGGRTPLIQMIFHASGTGGADRTVFSKLSDVVSVKDFGAVCDSSTDDTSAINAALAAVLAAGGGTVNLPCGKTCMIKPSGTSTYLSVGSGTTLQGCGASSVIKVASTAGNYKQIFGLPQSQGDADITLRNFKVDQNPTGNTSGVDIRAVGSTCPSGTNTCQQYVLFYWPTSPNLDQRIMIDGMLFDPTSGVNTITIGSDGALQTTIRNSYFNFVQGPTSDANGYYDNSAIYLEGSQQIVANNHFISTYANHANGAVETHGGRSTLSNNTTVKYAAGVNVASTQASFTELNPDNITISNNSFTDVQFGVNIYPTTGHTTRNVAINGNTINVSNLDRSGTGTLFNVGYAGIRTVYDASGLYNGDVEQLMIQGNVITMQKENRAYAADFLSGGVLLYHQGSLNNAQVSNNIIRDSPTVGVRVYSALGTANRIGIFDNQIIDAGNNTLSTYRSGIYLQGTITNMNISRNLLFDTGNPILGLNSISYFVTATGVRVWDNLIANSSGLSFPQNSANTAGVTAGDGTNDTQAFTVGGGGTVFPNTQQYSRYELTANAGTGAFTISSPSGGNAMSGQRIDMRIINSSGGVMGAITWNAIYKMSAWANPANGFNRSITFQFNGTNWVEIGRTTLDVPN